MLFLNPNLIREKLRFKKTLRLMSLETQSKVSGRKGTLDCLIQYIVPKIL